MNYETKIAMLLQVAKEQLSYTNYIGKYAIEHGYRNLDTSAPRDKFYKNANIAFFHESLLATFSLLDNDVRVISFFNWPEFMAQKSIEIKAIKKKFANYGFVILRNQVVAHLDNANSLNRMPNVRQTAMMSEEITERLMEIINDLTNLFHEYTDQYSSRYTRDLFDTAAVEAQLADIMEAAQPTMTHNPVI